MNPRLLLCSLMLVAGLLHAAPADDKIIRSVQSGAWSEAATWSAGRVPPAGASVQIRTGHTVLYDRDSAEAVRAIFVAGTLRFARDRDTRLEVGLLKIQAGDDTSE